MTQQLALSFELPSQGSHDREDTVVVATWNVNSIRARHSLLASWLERERPDVVCLQETKVADDQFPSEEFAKFGYSVVRRCNGGRNGVAILSRLPMRDVVTGLVPYDNEGDRVIAATIGDVRLVCVYAPNAYSVSDEGFVRKTNWLNALTTYVDRELARHGQLLVCGDFNVTPSDADLHDARQWLYATFVHPDVRAPMRRVASVLVDLYRLKHEAGRGFTWWDYRGDALAQDRGIRIDHFYAAQPIATNCTDVKVAEDIRHSDKASDHAPVVATFVGRGNWVRDH